MCALKSGTENAVTNAYADLQICLNAKSFCRVLYGKCTSFLCVCVINCYMCQWQNSALATSEDRHMLIAFTEFCFVLLPGQVLEVGDRASNPGKGMFFLCYPLWIDCDGRGGGAGIDGCFQRGGKRVQSWQTAKEKCSRERHCQLVSLYFVDGIWKK
jgi:hypothetical protein